MVASLISIEPMKKIHILGICGTFMGGIAAIARELGFTVTGQDQNVYPPMSTQLQALGIALASGYAAADMPQQDDMQVVVGNALSRGNEAIEAVLNRRLPYTSGPEFLADAVLRSRRVLAVAGTHGKTTTTSMLAWILECAGRAPGFLVGGVPQNFGVSARVGSGEDFVIEADEYDTAFFDKRSKFVHYHPHVAILNNLEFDHADIFPDLKAIEKQFHHLIRTIAGNGKIIVNADEPALADVLAMGCWSQVERFSLVPKAEVEWRAELLQPDGSQFAVIHCGETVGQVIWSLLGSHNVANALGAIAAAFAVGVPVAAALEALPNFLPPKRRLELLGAAHGINVYDDFAHHPTAIERTLAGLRARVGAARIIVALEPRSNSMRMGAHAAHLAPSLKDADLAIVMKRANLPWDAEGYLAPLGSRAIIVNDTDAMLTQLQSHVKDRDSVVFMSNGGFDGVQQRFLQQLQTSPLN
jgi:UDP-N-acetylmuramate: L-alanyl-gamma-D-glutamyl-meso-diaminopimelate ligase